MKTSLDVVARLIIFALLYVVYKFISFEVAQLIALAWIHCTISDIKTNLDVSLQDKTIKEMWVSKVRLLSTQD